MARWISKENIKKILKEPVTYGLGFNVESTGEHYCTISMKLLDDQDRVLFIYPPIALSKGASVIVKGINIDELLVE